MLQDGLQRLWRHPLLPPLLAAVYVACCFAFPGLWHFAILGLMVFRGARIHGITGGVIYGLAAGPLSVLDLWLFTGQVLPPGLTDGLFWAWATLILLGFSVGALTSRELSLTQVNQDLVLAQRRLSALYRLSRTVSSTLDLTEILGGILEQLEQYFHYQNGAVLLVSEGGDLTIAAHRGYSESAPTSLARGAGICGWVAENGEAQNVGDVSRDPRYIAGVASARSELAVPITWNDQVIGVLNLESQELHAYADEDVTLLQTVAEQAAAAIANARLHQTTHTLAITDGPTGLYNYRHYQEQVQALIREYQLTPGTFSLLMVDLDYFKHVNDTYGHPTGDAILQQMAAMLQRNCRGHDRVFRYGGEEFAIVLPDTPKEIALRVAERVRQQLASNVFVTLTGRPLAAPLTCSIGVANYPDDAINHVDLLILADNALYAAKAQGRNRVIAAERSAPPSEASHSSTAH